MTGNTALRQAAQSAYDFLQDKSFIPDSDTHRCTAIVEALEAALRDDATARTEAPLPLDGLSNRAIRALTIEFDAPITRATLAGTSLDHLRHTPNIGKLTLQEIVTWAAGHGIEIRRF